MSSGKIAKAGKPKAKQQNPCCVYDFTVWEEPSVSEEGAHAEYDSEDDVDREVLSDDDPFLWTYQTVIDVLTEVLDTKSWAFQLEEAPTTKRRHFQGRFSLSVKDRLTAIVKRLHAAGVTEWRLSPTSKAAANDVAYVTKAHTRVDGPWTSEDEEKAFMPRQYAHIKPEMYYPYQQKILESGGHSMERRKVSSVYDICGGAGMQPTDMLQWLTRNRRVNALYDPHGNFGKSSIAAIAEILHGAIDLPPINDFKELVAVMCNVCMDTNNRDPGLVLVDIPRSMLFNASGEQVTAAKRDRGYVQLAGMFSAIEQIKKGKLYDCRHHYKQFWINAPTVWVFMNHLPDPEMLSWDRWAMWTINPETKDLVYMPHPKEPDPNA